MLKDFLGICNRKVPWSAGFLFGFRGVRNYGSSRHGVSLHHVVASETRVRGLHVGTSMLHVLSAIGRVSKAVRAPLLVRGRRLASFPVKLLVYRSQHRS